jgi:hypothetical protein
MSRRTSVHDWSWLRIWSPNGIKRISQVMNVWIPLNTYYSGAWPWPLERVYQYIVQLLTMTCTGVDTDTHTDHTNTHTHTSMHKYIYDVNIDWYINRMARGGKVDRIWSVPMWGFLPQIPQICSNMDKTYEKWETMGGHRLPMASQFWARDKPIGCRFLPGFP